MVDYIQQGFGNHGDWTLSNSNFELFTGLDSLKNGDDVSTGYGEKSYASIVNNDWRLTVTQTITLTVVDPRGSDIQVFLSGDANPIIFRLTLDDPEGFNKFQIIYNGVTQDSHVIDEDDTSVSGEIYRIGSRYYYTSVNLAFDYGSIVQPVKLRLGSSENNFSMNWHNLLWWYTSGDEDFNFVT